MNFSKFLILFVILMAGISFSGCVGNSSNDDDASADSENTVADSSSPLKYPDAPAKASLSDSKTMTATMSTISGSMMEKRRSLKIEIPEYGKKQKRLVKTVELGDKKFAPEMVVSAFSGQILNEDDSGNPSDENANKTPELWEGINEAVIAGTWEFSGEGEILRLVFTEDGKVTVIYNDMIAETKWTRDGDIYRIYVSEDSNDASVVFIDSDMIQYSVSDDLIYILSRVA